MTEAGTRPNLLFVFSDQWRAQAFGYTYIRTLEGPWLLYDNVNDPLQQTNLVAESSHAATAEMMDAALTERLALVGDDFASGRDIIEREGLRVHPNNELACEHPQKPLPEPYAD